MSTKPKGGRPKQVSHGCFQSLTKEVFVEVLSERSVEKEEVNSIVEEEGKNWITPIIWCLEEGIWPEDKKEA